MDDNNLETEDDDDEMIENATVDVASSRDEWLSDYRKQVEMRCQQVDERFSLMEKKLYTVYDLALAKLPTDQRKQSFIDVISGVGGGGGAKATVTAATPSIAANQPARLLRMGEMGMSMRGSPVVVPPMHEFIEQLLTPETVANTPTTVVRKVHDKINNLLRSHMADRL
jgi:hypothetical protein